MNRLYSPKVIFESDDVRIVAVPPYPGSYKLRFTFEKPEKDAMGGTAWRETLRINPDPNGDEIDTGVTVTRTLHDLLTRITEDTVRTLHGVLEPAYRVSQERSEASKNEGQLVRK